MNEFRNFFISRAGAKDDRIFVKNGFSVVVGPNNSGKTRFLRSLDNDIVISHSAETIQEACSQIKTNNPNQAVLRAVNFIIHSTNAYLNSIKETDPTLPHFKMSDFLNYMARRGEYEDPVLPNGENLYPYLFGRKKQILFVSTDRIPIYEKEHTLDKIPIGENGAGIIEKLYKTLNLMGYELASSVEIFKSIVRKVCEIDDIFGGMNVDGRQVVYIRQKKDGQVFELDKVGQGIKQAILILAMDTFYSNSLILIDEPETNLHPYLLNNLIAYIYSSQKNCYIICTHSSIPTRTEYAESIYLCASDESEISLIPIADRNEALEALGYNSIDNLVAEVLILVEGPNDRSGINALLETKLQNRHHKKFSILSMGGDAMRYFNCSHLKDKFEAIFTILDGETSPIAISARNEFRRINRRHLNSTKIFELERYSLDNYWSKNALNMYFRNQLNQTIPFPVTSRLRSIGLNEDQIKRKTRELALNTDWSEIENTDLGNAIDKIVKFLTK